VDPLGHASIGLGQFRDRREQVGFPVGAAELEPRRRSDLSSCACSSIAARSKVVKPSSAFAVAFRVLRFSATGRASSG
jgi:hypothetical protein